MKTNKKQTIFFIIFCALVFINPFPLGSNRVWAWSFEAIVASLLILTMLVCSQISHNCISWHRLKRMRLELRLLVIWLLIHFLYLVPIPLTVLQWLAPAVADAYRQVNESFGYLSLDLYASHEVLLLSLYYFILFIIGVNLINTRKKIYVILFLFLFLGVFESIYGMYLVSIDQTGTLVQVQSVKANNASGTFINKNHMVAFISMCFMFTLALRVLIDRNRERIDHLSIKIKVLRFISQPTRIIDFSLFIIFTGIWNTHSRAGLVSFIMALAFFYSMLFLSRKRTGIHIKKVLAAVITIVVVFSFVANDVSYVLDTLGKNTDDSVGHVLKSAEGRLLAIQQAIDHYPQYWLTGVGPGAYQVFFVNHRVLDQTAYFDHAHNDYIEFMIEYGLLSLVLMLLLIKILYKLIFFIFKTDSGFYRTLAISSISCIIYMMIHGTMDFNARIPANVVTIIVAISVIYGKIVKLDVNKVKKNV